MCLRVCMCVCVGMCMLVCVHVCVYVCVCVNVYVCMCMYVCVGVCVCVSECVSVYVYSRLCVVCDSSFHKLRSISGTSSEPRNHLGSRFAMAETRIMGSTDGRGCAGVRERSHPITCVG